MTYFRCKVLSEAPVIGADGWQYDEGEEVVLDDRKTNIEILNGIAWQILEALPRDYELVPPDQKPAVTLAKDEAAGKSARKAN